ncbi:MAG: hypothetical protein U9Q91_07245 [Candidatus Marinimicrobia bacterium]|nr:hypothetical protein [Candidatus Neomarinimicrobiota bacterium]
MRTFIQKYATWKSILILMGIVLLFQFLWFPQFLPKGEHAVMLDTEMTYNAEDAYEIIGNYTNNMRQRYILGEITLDLVFPVIYTFLFSFLIFFLYKNTTIALFPFLQMIFDYLENTGIVILLSAYPNKIMWLATATSIFSMIKWVLVGMTSLIVLLGAVQFVVKRRKTT